MRVRWSLWIVGGALVGLLYASWIRRHDADDSNERASANPSQISKSQALNSPHSGRLPSAFVYNNGQPPQRELAPTDPRYDPVAHSRQDDLTSKEIFEAEPRDTKFAPIFERRIRANYADAFKELHVESKVLSLDVECRTLSCFATIYVVRDDGKYVYDRIGGLVLGDVLMPSWDDSNASDKAMIKLYMLFKPDLREEENFQQAVDSFSTLVRMVRDEYARKAAGAAKETR